MEKIKISTLKHNIKAARRCNLDSEGNSLLDKIESTVKNSPSQFLRITKMNAAVLRLMANNG